MARHLLVALTGLWLCLQVVDAVQDTQLSHADQCCDALQTLFPALTSFPNQVTYINQQNGTNDYGYFSLQESELYPACRLAPTCSAEVAQIVKYLAQNNCTFAVRGGGHTPWAGAANIDKQGLTIDLSLLNSVVVSEDQTVVSVGGGARWLDVYMTLDDMGLAVAGGRTSTVGVGGLTLGGGKSFFQSARGFACDNVQNYELVTSTGSVLQVNHRSHPKLFKALKGGSSNFGIVTRFDLQAFKQGKMWGGLVAYWGSVSDMQLQNLYDFIESSQEYNASAGEAQVIYSYQNFNNLKTVSVFLSYTLPEAWPARFAGFEAVGGPLLSTVRVSNLTDFTNEIATYSPHNFRYSYATLTIRNNLDLFHDLENFTDEAMASLAAVSGLNFAFVLQPLVSSMLAVGCGKNSLGLCPIDGNLVIVDISVQWNLAIDDQAVHAAIQRLVDQATASAIAKRALHRYIYLNYAMRSQNPLLSYGKKNVAALRAASRKYDPEQVFQRLMPGGFKL